MLERFAWHRTRKDISSDDNLVDVVLTDLTQDRFERGKIAVDIAQHCDAHGWMPPLDHRAVRGSPRRSANGMQHHGYLCSPRRLPVGSVSIENRSEEHVHRAVLSLPRHAV